MRHIQCRRIAGAQSLAGNVRFARSGDNFQSHEITHQPTDFWLAAKGLSDRQPARAWAMERHRQLCFADAKSRAYLANASEGEANGDRAARGEIARFASFLQHREA